jgi:small-conductance mechanosensitive channel
MGDFLIKNWSAILIPASVFLVSLIILFWLRKMALSWLVKRFDKSSHSIDSILIRSLRTPLSLICLILSLYSGLAVSQIPEEWKNSSGNGLWTLFVLTVTVTFLNLAKEIIFYYGDKYNTPQWLILIIRNTVWITIMIVGLLIILDFWGFPTTLLLLLAVVAILIAGLAFRDTAPDFFAGFQIAAAKQIKVGDFIKLENGGEGYITAISWNKTVLESPDGSTVFAPNSLLVRHKVINYGRPLKKARQPFLFRTNCHTAESTGLKAGNIHELVEILKQASEDIIHYHTHDFLKEYQYLISPCSNDFALWVRDSLENSDLAKKLANIDKFQFKSPMVLRDEIVEIIEECVSTNSYGLQVPRGKEFKFKKSVITELPVIYKARDLREFNEDLRKINLASLYYHVFESRLKLDPGMDNFSLWLQEAMEEDGLSREISEADFQSLSLEKIRSILIQTIEKHVK